MLHSGIFEKTSGAAMKCLLFFILSINLTSVIYSEIPSVVPAFEGEPSANIDACVSAVSGAYYVAEQDIVVPGREPIVFPRILTREKFHASAGGWSNFPQVRLEETLESFTIKGKTKMRKQLFVRDSCGITITYLAKHYKNDQVFYPIEESLKGFTNTAKGGIGGKTNPRNRKITYDGKRYVLHLPDGTARSYKLDKNVLQTHQERTFKLSNERLPNGNYLRFKYDKESRLKYICSTNPDKTKVYAWAKINPAEFIEPGFAVTTSDGNIYRYYYEKKGKDTHLDRITKNGIALEKISYKDYATWQVQGRNFCGKRRTKAKYYSDQKANRVAGELIKLERGDQRIGRVKYLKVPERNSDRMQISKSFLYHFPLDKKGRQEIKPDRTKVIDSVGNEVTYHYTDEQVLIRTDYFDKKYGHLLCERAIFDSQGKILVKLYKDGSGEIKLARSYKYDSRGNVLVDTLYGNFSGKCGRKIQLEKKTIAENGVESHQTIYEYNSRNLITKKIESNGRVIEYRYLPKTDHILAEYTSHDQQIVRRKIFTYGQDNLVVSEIVDDGSTYNLTDLTGVTERRITKYTYWTEGPALDLPKTIEKRYWQGGNERLLGKTHLQYNKSCQVTKKSTFDSEGKYRYSEEYRYDQDGNRIYSKDSLGRELTSAYDQFGNKLTEEEEETKLTTKYKYNRHNQQRLKQIENPETGEILEEKTYYNSNGHVSAKIDYLNNKTTFMYDMFGNVREETKPENLAKDGTSIKYKRKRTYNFQSKCTEETDVNGNTTTTTYNARGKPIVITYPDSTYEQYTYDIHGQVIEHIDRLGRVTIKKYDLDHRPIEIETRSQQGELLNRLQNTYSAFHLVAQKNHLNIETIYRYDGAGRRVEEKCITPEGTITTSTEYNTLNYPYRITIEADNCPPRIKKVEYDYSGEIVEETLEDETGKIYQKTSYTYDTHGNKSQTITHLDGRKSIETDEYDLFDRLVKKTNALGDCITISYKKIKKQMNKPITLQKITKEFNRKTTETYDALGRVSTKEISNNEGEQVFYETYSYDGKGQLLQQTSHIQPQNLEKTTEFSYDTNGNLTTFIEAKNSPEERTTTYTYNAEGKQLTHTKPDGTILTRTYDPYGREKTLTSSLGDIAYNLIYDPYGNLIEAQDLVQNTTTKRKVSLYGYVQKETLANGITIRSKTDLMGNRQKTLLPDNTYIAYSYDPYHLRKITRYNQQGEKQYAHKYSQYNLTDTPHKQTLILDLGTQTHQFDLLKREIRRTTPFHQEAYDQFDPNGNLLAKNLSLESAPSTYTYNALDQIIQETGPWENTYTADSHHNRLTKNDHEYEADLLNQLQTADTNTYTYDFNGNPTAKNQSEYEYDSLDRLISVITPTKTYTYTYDYFHRRIAKNNRHYIYDGENEIGRQTNGEIDQLRILGLGRGAEIGAAIAIELSNKTYLPLHSIRGDIIALIDPQTQRPISYTSYSAFGEHTQKGTCPWRFQSKRHDPETHFTYFGRRYYEPETGRFFTPDPKGKTEVFSLYTYVNNNPLTLFDLYGLEPVSASLIGYCAEAAAMIFAGEVVIVSYLAWEVGKGISRSIEKKQEEKFFTQIIESSKNDNGNSSNFSTWEKIEASTKSCKKGGSGSGSGGDDGGDNKKLDQNRKYSLEQKSINEIVKKFKNTGGSQNNLSVRLWPGPDSNLESINGLSYTVHALERMAPKGLIQKGIELYSRGIPPSVIENAINFGTKTAGNTPNETVHVFGNVKVVTNNDCTKVITVIKTGN